MSNTTETHETNPSNIRSLADARTQRKERNEATLEKLRTGTLSTVREPYSKMGKLGTTGPAATRADLNLVVRATQECQDQVVRLTTAMHDMGLALAEVTRIQQLLVSHVTGRLPPPPGVPDPVD